MKLLYVEDSSRLQHSVGAGLRKAGHDVEVVGDGNEALVRIGLGEFDLIVLDLMLPGLDGMSVLRRLREQGSRTRVLILTCKDTVEDRVTGLRAGADDYLVKPFAFAELLARIDALGRRQNSGHGGLIIIGDLEINTASKQAKRGGQILDLPPREYALLELLALRQGQVVSRSQIEAHIYDVQCDPMSNVVDAAIYSLRKRVDPPELPALIQTRRGYGYLLEAPA